MHSLFRRTFVAFISSFAVLLVVLGGALVAGYNHSLSTWSARRVTMVEEAARQLLSAQRGPVDPERASDTAQFLPQDVPVFVYDADGALIASNRGVGRRRDLEHEERIAVRAGDQVLGYFSVGATVFRNDAANRALAQSLVRAAFAGALAAFAAAAVAAWGFARSLSRPAARVAQGIASIAHGTPREPIPEVGAGEIAQIARAANTLASRLSDESRLRAQWAQDVTHDLRTPVASIRAQLEAIVDGVYQAEPQRIKGALAELERVERLISDLEELMRLEEPNVRLSKSQFNSRDFSSTLKQRFARAIESKDIAYVEQLQDCSIVADEALLYRAVSNLITNAVRHARVGGRIRYTLACDSGTADGGANGALRITITNDGPAIPEHELPHLFERLYRGEYARCTEGSGLGLTIAQRIVALHNGTIDIRSSTQEGTTVTVTLPQQPIDT